MKLFVFKFRFACLLVCLLLVFRALPQAAFLDPVAAHLETRESGGNWADSLNIDSNCLVTSVLV